MYKVFYNSRTITITGFHANTTISPGNHVVRVESLWQVPGLVKNFLSSSESDWVLEAGNEEKLWSAFTGCFVVILAAGGFVRKGGQFLFMYRRKKWDLPKGKVEEGEIIQDAAIREVEEECGISGMRIVEELPVTWHIYLSPWPESQGLWVLKQTVWFLMDYSGDELPIPEVKEGITRVEWLAPDDFGKVLKNTYPNLEPIITRYL